MNYHPWSFEEKKHAPEDQARLYSSTFVLPSACRPACSCHLYFTNKYQTRIKPTSNNDEHSPIPFAKYHRTDGKLISLCISTIPAFFSNAISSSLSQLGSDFRRSILVDSSFNSALSSAESFSMTFNASS